MNIQNGFIIKKEHQNGSDTSIYGIFPNIESAITKLKELIKEYPIFKDNEFATIDLEKGYAFSDQISEDDCDDYISLTIISLPILPDTFSIDVVDDSLECFMKNYYGVNKLFLDVPIMEDDLVVDALTDIGNTMYGEFSNMLMALGDVLERYYPDYEMAKKMEDIVEKLDDIANGIVKVK